MDRGQRLRLAVVAAALVAVAVVAIVIGREPDWRVLCANLAEKDGGAVVAQLATTNVPYTYAEGGGAVMVPADKVHEVRLRLASQDLPKGSVAVSRFFGNIAVLLFIAINGQLPVLMAIDLFASGVWIALPMVGMLLFVNLTLMERILMFAGAR